MGIKLGKDFYHRSDTIAMAQELLGKMLFTNIDHQLTGGIIVETEAYMGVVDSSCHTYNNRKTKSNATMYQQGGVAYMYICYGIHDMLNIVTGNEGDSQVILIRALEPTVGIEVMKERRGGVPVNRLSKGPGSLAKALRLTKKFDNYSLMGEEIWIEENDVLLPENKIISSPRIGLNCSEPYLSMPWRFTIAGNKFVSR
jgi:DNA-3-methyladenine glycosylase